MACGLGLRKDYLGAVMQGLWDGGVDAVARVADGFVWASPTGSGGVVDPAAPGHLLVAERVGWDANGFPVVSGRGDWLTVRRPAAGEPIVFERELSELPAGWSVGVPTRDIEGAAHFANPTVAAPPAQPTHHPVTGAPVIGHVHGSGGPVQVYGYHSVTNAPITGYVQGSNAPVYAYHALPGAPVYGYHPMVGDPIIDFLQGSGGPVPVYGYHPVTGDPLLDFVPGSSRAIFGYDRMTGAPILDFEAGTGDSIVGYHPQSGQVVTVPANQPAGVSVLRFHADSGAPIFGFDPQTGRPVLGTEPFTQAPILGYEPQTGAPILGTEPGTGGPGYGHDPITHVPMIDDFVHQGGQPFVPHAGPGPMPAAGFSALPRHLQILVAEHELAQGARTFPTDQLADAYGLNHSQAALQALPRAQWNALRGYSAAPSLVASGHVAPATPTYMEINAVLRTVVNGVVPGAGVRADALSVIGATGGLTAAEVQQHLAQLQGTPELAAYEEIEQLATAAGLSLIQVIDVLDVIEDMDTAMAQQPLPDDVVIVRGSNINRLPANLPTIVGQTFSESAYTSTSLAVTPLPAFASKPSVMHWRVPAGTPAIWMAPVSFYPAELELLLARGVRFRVDRVIFEGGKWHIYGTVL